MNNVETKSDYYFNQKYPSNRPHGYYVEQREMINNFNYDKPKYYNDTRYNLGNNNNIFSNMNKTRFVNRNNNNSRKIIETHYADNNISRRNGTDNCNLSRRCYSQKVNNMTRKCIPPTNNNTKNTNKKSTRVRYNSTSSTNKNKCHVSVHNLNDDVVCDYACIKSNKKGKNLNITYNNSHNYNKPNNMINRDYYDNDDSDDNDGSDDSYDKYDNDDNDDNADNDDCDSDYSDYDMPKNKKMGNTIIKISATNENDEDEDEDEEAEVKEKKTRCKKKFMGKNSLAEVRDMFKLPWIKARQPPKFMFVPNNMY